ncbi:hypothetical protein L345_13168, partial [Ophiophagus hannah]
MFFPNSFGQPLVGVRQHCLLLLSALSPDMPYCGPSCAVPSCASAPVIGLGSSGCGPWGYGYRGLGLGYGAGALAETSGSLGTLAGVIPSCINQIPASEVTVQPPSVVVTIPGPILSASCEPVAVGGHTPCAAGGYGRYGGYYGGRLGRFGRRGSVCALPCNPC